MSMPKPSPSTFRLFGLTTCLARPPTDALARAALVLDATQEGETRETLLASYLPPRISRQGMVVVYAVETIGASSAGSTSKPAIDG
ncbi:MAG: hypothetical protein M1829_000688 [Trizodia sp. TS-e1964]|nr:MAG: hypothetical protein M1829_000688 [Trizodia sp. TS-e1964]